jgi:hypothetical protein
MGPNSLHMLHENSHFYAVGSQEQRPWVLCFIVWVAPLT